MQQQVKVYFENEIRRFNLNPGSGESLYDVLQKLVVEAVGHENVRISWKDSDGDVITFGSEDEFQIAVDSIPAEEKILRIYVKSDASKSFSPGSVTTPKMSCTQTSNLLRRDSRAWHLHGLEKHSGVICDGCDCSVTGTRYKCLVCEDFDLCPRCEQKGSIHREHDFIAIRKSTRGEWQRMFAIRHMAYGNNSAAAPVPRGFFPGNIFQYPVQNNVEHENTSTQSTPRRPNKEWLPWNNFADRTVEMDININQPLENLLKDVNNQVKRVLQGFMPADEAVPVVVASDQLKSSGVEFIHETVVREDVPVEEQTSAVEKLDETVKKEEAKVIVKMYPELATAPLQTADSVTETGKSEINVSIPSSEEIENGWALIDTVNSATENESSKGRINSNQIDAALKVMIEMGFPNEGNILRLLLENFNGDIEKVLDTLPTP